jgi:[amino group carrier protein]-L-2-aminoadipate 6-kinase
MILIKIGGGKQININAICADIKTLIDKGEKIILVHGASTTRDEIAASLNHPTNTIVSPSGVSSVYTDAKSIDIFLMSYVGLINKRLVEKLQQHGVNAVGLSGIDGKLWQGKRKKVVYSQVNGKTKLISDSMTGKVEKINSSLITLLLENGYTPVLCPPAISDENEIINTDNDWATGVMVGALGIEKMVVLFEKRRTRHIFTICPRADEKKGAWR